MPTYKSIALKDRVLSYLENILGKSNIINSKPFVLSLLGKRVYLRVASEKSGSKYWFDVNPNLFRNVKVDFLIYACGSEHSVYVFPLSDFLQMLESANLGGVNQVPNFTIFVDSHELEPAGHSRNRYSINKYYNNYSAIKPIIPSISVEVGKVFEPLPPNVEIDVKDDEEIVLRKLREQYQLIRDSNLVRKLKSINKYRCQICNETIDLHNGILYSEAHHIKPLGQPHNGPDVLQNMLCVCPNCHVKLDYGAIKLDLTKLSISPEHIIDIEFINYHNQVICL